MSDYPDGGFEANFVHPPPDNLNCRVCLRVLNDAHLTSCCGHHFCYSCITKALQRSRACPLCNAPFTIFRAKDKIREVNALAVKCTLESAGCEWVGQMSAIVEHLKTCGYVRVHCTKCGEQLQQRLLAKHTDHLCPLRVYVCHYCNQYENTYENVAEQHWPNCGYFPVPCPNDCPKGSVPRNWLMAHLKNECKIQQQLKESRVRNACLSEEIRQLKSPGLVDEEHKATLVQEQLREECAASQRQNEEQRDKQVWKRVPKPAIEMDILELIPQVDELKTSVQIWLSKRTITIYTLTQFAEKYEKLTEKNRKSNKVVAAGTGAVVLGLSLGVASAFLSARASLAAGIVTLLGGWSTLAGSMVYQGLLSVPDIDTAQKAVDDDIQESKAINTTLKNSSLREDCKEVSLKSGYSADTVFSFAVECCNSGCKSADEVHSLLEKMKQCVPTRVIPNHIGNHRNVVDETVLTLNNKSEDPSPEALRSLVHELESQKTVLELLLDGLQ